MRNDNFYGSGIRSQKRKKQKADKILNISIGVVVFLILLVGGQLFLGGKSPEKAVSSKMPVQATPVTNEETEEVDEDVEAKENLTEVEVDEETPEETTNANETPTNQNQGGTTQQTGQWQPIGTVQEEPFVAIYDRDHVNWLEMTKAFQVATGLDDTIILWRVSNGGDHQSAVGIVSDSNNRNTPYQVRIEWVTNEGWMPVSVEKLTENPF
ncbi:DUF1510 family protein [Anaerobacillus alkaliphilus]|uniref:DUF1510 family protein n=1 Tax=Anaerobacillus alkaliphilus TaxID=1548597 RepID=A0A4Q0VS52_9BACI|nr:DUF1510 family protein [Anaerobacillus alkaliphilus]RXI99965.1 DUF1510 family protein [Anaerobacillus alkaliphilus]